MRKPLLLAVSTAIAAAFSLPVLANDYGSKSSSASDRNAASTSAAPSDTQSATGSSSAATTSADQPTGKTKAKRRFLRGKPHDADTNNGAAGGESAGKKSDAPGQ